MIDDDDQPAIPTRADCECAVTLLKVFGGRLTDEQRQACVDVMISHFEQNACKAGDIYTVRDLAEDFLRYR